MKEKVRKRIVDPRWKVLTNKHGEVLSVIKYKFRAPPKFEFKAISKYWSDNYPGIYDIQIIHVT